MTIARGATMAFVFCLPALPALSQELTIGLGATDFGTGGDNSAVFDLEYRHTPFFQRKRFSSALGANASVTGEGDVFVGAGIWSRVQFDNGVFIESSMMPGLYNEGTRGNDLGSAFHFRSLLGVGYKFDTGRALSIAAVHKSNAGLGDDNPGLNTYSIRYHISF